MNIHKKVFLVVIALLAGTSTTYAVEVDSASVAKKTVKKAAPHSSKRAVPKKKPTRKTASRKKPTSAESKAAPATRKPRTKRAAPKKSPTAAAAKKATAKKAPTRSPQVTPTPATPKKRAPRKTTPKAASAKAASTTGWPLPIRIKDLPGLSNEASHTHTYSSVAQRIAESGERTNTQLKEVLRDTARGQAPDTQTLSGIAANYHNLGNFVEALSTSSPETVHKLMLETPNLKPLAHKKR